MTNYIFDIQYRYNISYFDFASRVIKKEKKEQHKGVKYMLLYHSSNVVVQKPQILENGFYKDFGHGFKFEGSYSL